MLEVLKDVRSHRSFTKKAILEKELIKMIEGARYSATSKNSQKLRYVLITERELCNKIFPLVKFAGAIEWNPTCEEAPTAYILICSEIPLKDITETSLYFDMGVATQNIMLMANSLGYSGCIIASYNKSEVDNLVNLPENMKSNILLALGEPRDIVTVVDMIEDNRPYYREGEKHFVSKLPLDKLILFKK